ncbi:hypothetical protein [Curtobacterium sp. MCPF17_051]|uniref:hypothetical protein n=1 Tax=Curtobacterium sp. MCPF17_051 TaxID=2175640 RepID=UPI0011B4D3B4|nr:hypothetical protein [Curtobacterium sp. MCPF17_051]
MDFYDHEPVTDDELAEMPEDQRLRATMNRQLIEEARAARDAFVKANSAYSETWDRSPATTPEEADRALEALIEVQRLFNEFEAAQTQAFDFLRSVASDNPPREAGLGGH